MHPFTLAADALAFDTGATRLFDGVSLTLGPGTRRGVVGPNGSGKSTLLRLLGGSVAPTSGTVERRPRQTTVLLIDQEAPTGSATVASYLRDRTGVRAAEQALHAASAALADDGSPAAGDRYDRALAGYLAVGADDLDDRRPAALAHVGLHADADRRTVGSLSRGQASRVQLALLELARSDVLLLDEPTNDLDGEGLELLDRRLAGHEGAVCVVSHDRAFLERTVDDVLELTHDGPEHYRGGWDAYREERERKQRLAAEAWERDRAERAELVASARRRREWSAKGVRTARRSAEPDKFVRHGHIQRAQKQGAVAARLDRALDRLDPVDKPWEGWDLHLDIPLPAKGSRHLAALIDVEVVRGDAVVGPCSLELSIGERVRLAGRNGAGKSTMVDVLLGRLEPTRGTVHVASSTVIGEIGQRRDVTLGPPTLLAWMIEAAGTGPQEARAALAPFGLRGEALERPPATLSTGERTRAELAVLQARGVNLLVLDEPTNHLDLDAIEALEEALRDYRGALLVVSHDTRFVESLAIGREVAMSPPYDDAVMTAE